MIIEKGDGFGSTGSGCSAKRWGPGNFTFFAFLSQIVPLALRQQSHPAVPTNPNYTIECLSQIKCELQDRLTSLSRENVEGGNYQSYCKSAYGILGNATEGLAALEDQSEEEHETKEKIARYLTYLLQLQNVILQAENPSEIFDRIPRETNYETPDHRDFNIFVEAIQKLMTDYYSKIQEEGKADKASLQQEVKKMEDFEKINYDTSSDVSKENKAEEVTGSDLGTPAYKDSEPWGWLNKLKGFQNFDSALRKFTGLYSNVKKSGQVDHITFDFTTPDKVIADSPNDALISWYISQVDHERQVKNNILVKIIRMLFGSSYIEPTPARDTDKKQATPDLNTVGNKLSKRLSDLESDLLLNIAIFYELYHTIAVRIAILLSLKFFDEFNNTYPAAGLFRVNDEERVLMTQTILNYLKTGCTQEPLTLGDIHQSCTFEGLNANDHKKLTSAVNWFQGYSESIIERLEKNIQDLSQLSRDVDTEYQSSTTSEKFADSAEHKSQGIGMIVDGKMEAIGNIAKRLGVVMQVSQNVKSNMQDIRIATTLTTKPCPPFATEQGKPGFWQFWSIRENAKGIESEV